MKATPFKRAIAMMQMISAALAAGRMLDSINLPEYKSRGHGLGKHTGKKWGASPSGKYDGVENGKRECSRRSRQSDLGHIFNADGKNYVAVQQPSGRFLAVSV